MGKGRDKRKKHEDPVKAVKRSDRQAHKRAKGMQKGDTDGDEVKGFNNEEAPEVTLNRIRKQEGKMRTTLVEENAVPPSPRANVVFTLHPEREQELMLFGGEYWDGEKTVAYNDLYFYNIKRNVWSRLVTAVNPPPRSSSQGVVYKHFLIVFGGEFVSQSQSQFLHFKDVWRFDAKKYEWEELTGVKGGPSSRSGHRMCLWRRSAIVFGGFYDNAHECHYFNDLWILSCLDGAGKWTAVKTAPYGELPHPRSGHSMAVCNDTLFVYGGFSTEKFNRFKKLQANVHHDLWSIKLPQHINAADNANAEGDFALWTKIRLGGIPPPIRCGVGSAFKDNKMYLFGGVVDIESPGGKVVSTFTSDLFVFHMDTKRFYPIVLRARKKTTALELKGGDLQSELRALHLQHLAGNSLFSAADSEEEEEEEEDGEESYGSIVVDEENEMKESFEVNKRGQIYPHRRMNASMLIMGNTLYIFGGQFESGSREVTMSDLFSFNLNTCDTYRVLLAQDLSRLVWLGKEAEASEAGSWESGSTVVSAAFDLDYDEDDDEDTDNTGEAAVDGGVDLACIPRALEDGDNDDEPPQVVPAELDTAVTPSREIVDCVTTVKGKKGLKVHKEQLLAQLGSGSAVPTPLKDETPAVFFQRTTDFWVSMASESFEDLKTKQRQSEKRVHKQAMGFAYRRYHEANRLLEQLRIVQEREEEEARFFKERREKKEEEWEAYERQLAEDEEDNDEERDTEE
ncbi:kelch repeat-containing protein [Trypanosoma rangeli]|uniref:Kelch repeat-containing protein n=1 Tax=Trypanosoma rangeli TaxID=5698 RepID=A0A422NAE1_TRYRA|nr:kelch repeat-containing protein [Trypanosoma rangeli]RNF02437.1 kelch repeat-containing protein [Trypanosoma rangeli]|eukprot:RNF02437.1 kelch repeat-containing protein [Trypanosoma rangeli]